jgi:hypothetical protein
VNPASILPLVAEIERLVAELRAALDPDGPGGKRITPAEGRRIGRRLVKVAGDLLAVLA